MANHGLCKSLCAFVQLPKAKSNYTAPHRRLLAVPVSHTLPARPPRATTGRQKCSTSVYWALSEFPSQEIHWCTSQHRHYPCLLLSSWKYLTEVCPVSELAPHHSTDTAHAEQKAAPRLLVSSSTPFATAGEMEEKRTHYAKQQVVPRLQQEGRMRG